eukprot:CAMPEP_0172549416 /NCGR_PEP_ID=MMETSP1067-20121228/18519_1 /TAXON_ID=265564 ORGANISM="Thalassiosira punctigera, Strain Tpunct2005C2" /NCGR_SAMPLE_ID=MMETSP1067 /ASSEMBLY_ACC=CAM_ASM_000444 /LENGTH=1149 /DNA_ID=CAMNT_0013336807 /DNA_START=119 /DNA_END=3568 /DNA_ORIENTATION=+
MNVFTWWWLFALANAAGSVGGVENANDGGVDGVDDPLCPRDEDNDLRKTLNVHLVPHTHDDVGWLKTVDQYYYGLNNTIQQAHVSMILDNVLSALLDPHTDHNRTFTYVETKFFSMWYLPLPSTLKRSLKRLINEKRFSFANGGWCMHDEATTHYMGMIDQTTLGHKFLKEELGVVPTVGWQIDPFGHSATQGGLLTSGVGFDSLFFGRIHYIDLKHRQGDAECEGLWSSSLDNGSPVFWGLTGSYQGNYGGPEGFCFDALCADEPLVGQSEDALLKRVQRFTQLLAKQANQTKGRNLMLTMGMDFFYSQARKNFNNLDRLIDATHRFLANGLIEASDIFGYRFNKVNIFYSTPERYTKCKHTDKQTPNDAETKYDPTTWDRNVKTGDFLPYADCDHCYWTGYFSSRQGLKRMERVGSSFLHMARQIEAASRLDSSLSAGRRTEDDVEDEAGETMEITKIHVSWAGSFVGDTSWNPSPLYSLDDAMGIAQHHDAVSGTSKQHVAYDYAKRITEGMNEANSFVTGWLRELLLDPTSEMVELDDLSYCHLLNETICEVSQGTSQDDNKAIYAIVYNALANPQNEFIPLPVDSDSHYFVERLEASMEWSAVDSNIIPNPNYAKSSAAAQFTLHFKASDLPPLGAAVFRIRKSEEKLDPISVVARSMRESTRNLRTGPSPSGYALKNELEVSNGVLSVTFDRSTGVIKSISEQGEGGVSVGVENEYGFYEAFFHKDNPKPSTQFKFGDSMKGDGVCLPGYTDAEGDEMPWLLGTAKSWQNAGAYIFRPTLDQSFHIVPPKVAPNLVVYESGMGTEVHAEFGDPAWIKQITRLIDGKNYVEVEYAVGPVPIEDGVGKDVVARYLTTVQNKGIFYTDSNGRDFMQRKQAGTSLFGYDTPEFDAHLEPVAGNYYPVNAATFIEDQDHSFGVLVDRSQGGSSLSDGSLELMIQRRLLHDDARGVGEALNETGIGITPCPPYGKAERLGEGVIIKGTHRLVIGKNGATQTRQSMDQFFSQPHIFVASAPKDVEVHFRQPNLSMLKASLPGNVMVVTYAALVEENAFLVRLAHQYGKDEGVLSSPAHVNLKDLFPNHDIVSVTEKTLSANQDRSAWEERRLQWNNTARKGPAEEGRLHKMAHVFMLKPLEIRTFEVIVL